MRKSGPRSRRDFLRLCGGASAALACGSRGLLAAPPAAHQAYAKVLLVDRDGAPVRCEALGKHREYVFQYPYRATPCFLIDLGEPLPGGNELTTEDGRRYRWTGGVGPNRSVVAFSAICAHKLSHPSRVVSFIGYREQPVGFLNRQQQVERRAGVIQCCSEHSIYDPAAGAAVVAGPSPQPLAAIELRYEQDALYATGVYGGELFARYFQQFGERLMLEYLGSGYSDDVADTSTVIPGEEFTRNRIRCG